MLPFQLANVNYNQQRTEPAFVSKPHLQRYNDKLKKQSLKYDADDEDEDESTFWTVSKYFIATLAILGAAKYVHSTFQDSEISSLSEYIEEEELSQRLPRYLEEIEKMKPDYIQQPDKFWDIIKSFPFTLLSDQNPEAPAVLLMVTPADGLNLATQISRQLAQILNKILGSNPKHLHFVEGNTLATQNPDVQKMMLDQQIHTMVDNQGQKTVVILNLEKIDPKAVMIFHAYCDNSEAVYKNIAIILILKLPSGVHVKTNEDVYAHLSQIWNPLKQSRINALSSRMANNIAILNVK